MRARRIVRVITLSPAASPNLLLRQQLDDLAPRAGFTAEVVVLPISVAALMTPKWVARHLDALDGVERMILPGHCRGDLAPIVEKLRGAKVEPGPEDLRDLPRFFGQTAATDSTYGAYRHRNPGRDQPRAWISAG